GSGTLRTSLHIPEHVHDPSRPPDPAPPAAGRLHLGADPAEAKAVRVIAAGGAPAGCVRQGEIEVSVKNSVAFYERNQVKVRDELETLARNEAPGLGANVIQPLGEPTAGTQRFAGWQCR